MIRAVCSKDLEWERVFNHSVKVCFDQLHLVKERAILNLLQLGASLGDLEWDGSGDLIHKPTGFGYTFKTESGESWIQYTAEPIVKR